MKPRFLSGVCFGPALVLALGLALPLAFTGCASHPSTKSAEGPTPYRGPLTTPGALFGALPPTVQNTVRSQVGSEEIDDVIRDTSSGRVVYKIVFHQSQLYPPLYIAPDGSVLNPDFTVAVEAVHGLQVKRANLPAPVAATLQEKAPKLEVAWIVKETWGKRDVYIVAFKDEAHNPRLNIAADGTVVEEQ